MTMIIISITTIFYQVNIKNSTKSRNNHRAKNPEDNFSSNHNIDNNDVNNDGNSNNENNSFNNENHNGHMNSIKKTVFIHGYT